MIPHPAPTATTIVWDETERVLRIVRETAKRYGLRSIDLRGQSRSARVAMARHVAMWLSRRIVGASYPTIARAFFGRHHTTVMAAIWKVEARRAAQPEWAADLDAFEQELRR